MRTYRTATTKEEFKQMTKADKQKRVRSLLRTYEEHSGATKALIGFTVDKRYYYTIVDKILPKWCKLIANSSQNGGGYKVQLNPDVKYRRQLVKSGKCVEFDESVLHIVPKSKGNSFEKFITETFTDEVWKHDNKPFYKGGDVVINGEQVQVKFASAQVVREHTIINRSWAQVV